MSLTDPQPLSTLRMRPELEWTFVPRFTLTKPRIHSQLSFDDVLRFRRSERRLGAASMTEVCSVLSAAATCLYVKSEDGLMRSRRPSIASGALHPVEIFFIRSSKSVRVFHFDGFTATVSVASACNHEALEDLWKKATILLPEAVSTLVVLLARPAVLETAYENSQSLLWRDSGALLQTLSMTACSLGLGFCPVGLLGTELIDALPKASETLAAVGAAWLGRIK